MFISTDLNYSMTVLSLIEYIILDFYERKLKLR